MNYTLMHKNIEVADIKIDEAAVAIIDIGTVCDPRYLPLGVQTLRGGIDRVELNDWLRSRSIPASRSGIWDLYTHLGRNSTEHLILKCFALSLSDHYWVRPRNSGLKWHELNFFQNSFSPDVGEILFGHAPANRMNINLMSPDNTSEGWLRKKWLIINGQRVLAKGGSDPWQQEPFNEVIASAIMRRLGISHVPYTLICEGNMPLSLCENFLSVETELVAAWRVFHAQKMSDSDSDFSHILRCCDLLNIPNVRPGIEKMLTLDYIIANEDRHYNNFGFMRHAETLEWLGVAPVFDSGTSLWHNSLTIGSPRKCQPFQATHDEQLKLVTDLSWFNFEALQGIEQEIGEIFSQSSLIDKKRSQAIAQAVLRREDFVGQRVCN
jgi:hypothetical protein